MENPGENEGERQRNKEKTKGNPRKIRDQLGKSRKILQIQGKCGEFKGKSRETEGELEGK